MARIGVQIFLSNQLTQLKKPCYRISKRYTFVTHELTISSVIDRMNQTTNFIGWKREKWNTVISSAAYSIHYHAKDRSISIKDTGNLDIAFRYYDLQIILECNKDAIDIFLQPGVEYNMNHDAFLTYLHNRLKIWLTSDLYSAAIPIVNELMSVTKQQLQNLLL